MGRATWNASMDVFYGKGAGDDVSVLNTYRTVDTLIPLAFAGLPLWLTRRIAPQFYAGVTTLANHILRFRTGKVVCWYCSECC